MRTARRWLVAATAGVVVLSLAMRSARAQGLQWDAPPECPDAKHLDTRVTEIAAGQPIAVRGRVRVVRTGDAYRAELESFTAAGALRERQLSAASCEELVDAVATVFVASHVEETATPPAPAPAKPARDSSSPPVPSEGSTRWRVTLGARGIVDRGLLPETALGGAIDAAFGSERYRIEVRAAGLAPNVATSALGASADFHAFIGEAMMCGGFALASLRLGGCAGMTAALVRGRGVQVSDPRQESRVVPAPRIGVDIRWPAEGAFAVRADVSGRLALARPEFSVANDGPLHRPAPFAIQFLLGPELRF